MERRDLEWNSQLIYSEQRARKKLGAVITSLKNSGGFFGKISLLPEIYGIRMSSSVHF